VKKNQVKKIQVKKIKNNFNIELDSIASDKSISHRTAIFSLLSDKKSYIKNYLLAEDTLNSLNIVEQLGAEIIKDGANIEITPPKVLKESKDILDCGNSGTAIRLFSGFLSGIDGYFILTGDKYLRDRPMKRVIEPLSNIGAKIYGRDNNKLAPLTIIGNNKLSAFNFESKISSAQVKSAMILASLNGSEKSFYKEPSLSRDHTERMLKGMGVDIKTLDNGTIEINPISKPLEPLNIDIPSDPSSGFFFAVLTAITPNSSLIIKNTTLNSTRIEAYMALKRMGTDISFIEKSNIYEPIGDIVIKYAPLKAITIDKNISWLIDELPALSIAMTQAEGISIIKNAEELRVKESDRISTVVNNLKLIGVDVEEFKDGYSINGLKNRFLKSAKIDSYGDHRIAMSFAIAGTLCDIEIIDTDCIETSFPNFQEILSKFTKVIS